MGRPVLATLFLAAAIANRSQAQNPAVASVVNAFSNQGGQPVSPGELATIFGSNLAVGSAQCSNPLPLPTTCGGASVLIGGKPAPVAIATATQLTIQIPYEVSGTSTTLQVSRQSGSQTLPSNSVTIQVAPTAPGMSTSDNSGSGLGLFLNSSSAQITAASPAQQGDSVSAFGNGFGATNPAVATAAAAPSNPLARFVAPVAATVGGQPAVVLADVLVPNQVSIAQVNFQVPTCLAGGNQPFVVNVGGVNSPPVMLPVAPSKAAVSATLVISAGAYGAYPSVSPGSWVEIYGAGLSTTTRQWSGADFTGTNAPTSLDGVRVTIGGQQAFIWYISPTQVNAQVPSNVAVGPAQLTLTNAAGTTGACSVTVNALQPGLLAPSSFQVSGKQYTAAQFLDYQTFAVPVGAVAGVSSRPAKPGESIVLWGVGFGPATNGSNQSIPSGQVAPQSSQLVNPVQFQIGGDAATSTYAGLAPGSVGAYEFIVTVPSVPDSDAVPLTFTQSGVKGTQTLYIAVHQ